MSVTVLQGDALETLRTLPDGSARCCVTSPPYWGLRDYGTAIWTGGDPNCAHKVREKSGAESSTLGGGKATTGHQKEGFRSTCPRCGATRLDRQIGLETTPDQYVERMVDLFREVRRVLTNDGTLWLNLGDCYAGSGKGAWGNDHTRDKNRHRVKESYVPTRDESPLAGKTPRGLKPKDLVGIPWRVAFALQADGWYLRKDIIWAKPNTMPESTTDRPTSAHEYIFLFSKSRKYYYDADAIAEPCESGESDQRKMREQLPRIGGKTLVSDDARYKANQTTNIGKKRSVGGKKMANTDAFIGSARRRVPDLNDNVEAKLFRNARSVWTITTTPFPGAHFATFPVELPRRCILAGSAVGDTILDPFGGAGTVGLVADRLNRNATLIELNPEYCEMARRRINDDAPLFVEVK